MPETFRKVVGHIEVFILKNHSGIYAPMNAKGFQWAARFFLSYPA